MLKAINKFYKKEAAIIGYLENHHLPLFFPSGGRGALGRNTSVSPLNQPCFQNPQGFTLTGWLPSTKQLSEKMTAQNLVRRHHRAQQSKRQMRSYSYQHLIVVLQYPQMVTRASAMLTWKSIFWAHFDYHYCSTISCMRQTIFWQVLLKSFVASVECVLLLLMWQVWSQSVAWLPHASSDFGVLVRVELVKQAPVSWKYTACAGWKGVQSYRVR